MVLGNGKETSLNRLPWYVFLPVADKTQFLWFFSDPTSRALPVAGADGTYKITTATDANIYLRFKGNWAYIVDNPDHFKLIASHPDELLGELPEKYCLAARLSVKDLPAEIKRQCLDLLGIVPQEAIQAKATAGKDLNDPHQSLPAGAWSKEIETFVNDLDEVLLGLNLSKKRADKAGQTLRVDCRVTALPGSATAQWLARAQRNVTSDLAGFCLADASLALYQAQMLEDKEVVHAKAWLASLRAEATKQLEDNRELTKEQAAVAKSLLGDALQVVEKTVEGRKIDFGAAVLLDDNDSAIIAGMRLVDGDKLDKVVNRLLDEIRKEKPELAKAVKDVKTLSTLPQDKLPEESNAKPVLPAVLAGVHFHQVTFPVNSERLAMLFGNKVDVLLGIGPERLYLALGRDADSLLKEAMLKSANGQQNSGARFLAAPASLAELLSQTSGPLQRVAMSWTNLLAPNSCFMVTPTATPNGVNIRFEVEEGLLQPFSLCLIQWARISLMNRMGGAMGLMQPGWMQQDFVRPIGPQNRNRRHPPRSAPPPPADSPAGDTRSPF